MALKKIVVLECDGSICKPSNPETQGPLGGAHLTFTSGGTIMQVRRAAAETHGWSYDPATKKDRCPRCQHPEPPTP